MEHSCEAYWTKAEGLARDAICTMGLGAKRLTDAAKRQLEIADLRAGVNVGLRELGELLYATHTGTPTDSDRLLEKMQEIDGLKARLRELEGRAGDPPAVPLLRQRGPGRATYTAGTAAKSCNDGYVPLLRRIPNQ